METAWAWRAEKPAAIFRRPDLEIRPSPVGLSAWLVKDPISLRYYELGDEDYFLLRQLDGRASWNEICTRYNDAFAPKRLEVDQLRRHTIQLYRQGLLISDAAGQGDKLSARGERLLRRERRRRFSNPLAIRLPGIDPEPLLARLAPLCSWIFTPWFAAAYAALLVAAIVVAAINFGELHREAAFVERLLAAENLPLLAVAVITAKILHELAHAVACRRLGGECREIGVLLLVGLPCLYCDVTSVWMVPERRRRLLVGAAGILVEFGVAAAALLLWNSSAPGTFHAICLNLAVVCSVGTVLVNANPLLRYDGYFILTDLLGTTNLGERCDAALRRRWSRWFLGSDASDDTTSTMGRRGSALFAAASLAYRWALTIGVLWIVRQILAPRGLTPLADLLALFVLASMFVPPAVAAVRKVRNAARERRVDFRRLALRTSITGLLLAAALLWPLPYNVAAPAAVGLHDGQFVFVTTPGRLIDAGELGSQITAGAPVARLENLELRGEIARLQGDATELRATIDKLRLRRAAEATRDQSLSAALEAAERKLPALEETLRLRQAEAERLTLVALRDGMILPLPAALAPVTTNFDARQDSPHPDSPLDVRLRGKFWPPGTPLCAIGLPHELEAIAAVDQHAIQWVQLGSRVCFQFDAAGGTTITGTVIERAASPMTEPPRELVAAGMLAAAEQGGRLEAIVPHYLVRIRIDSPATPLPTGAVGRAKIAAEPQSLAARGMRWLAETFRFERGK